MFNRYDLVGNYIWTYEPIWNKKNISIIYDYCIQYYCALLAG